MVTTSEVAVSLTIDDDEHLDQLVAALKEFGEVVVDENLSIICLVGDLLVNQKDLLSNIFQAVGDKSIRMVSYGGSRNNISMLIPTPLKSEVLRLLNQKLFEGHKVSKA
jgi:aspartate kinase